MRQLGSLGAIIVLTAALPAWAGPPCSIHPRKGMSEPQLKSLAKLSQAEAQKLAVARVRGSGAVTVESGELEAEQGCLIWSFDLRRAGRPGVQEVLVDAGNGRVLSVKHESPNQEASEANKEKADNIRKQ